MEELILVGVGTETKGPKVQVESAHVKFVICTTIYLDNILRKIVMGKVGVSVYLGTR